MKSILLCLVVLLTISSTWAAPLCDGSNRTACGFIGIDQTGCESIGCCWAVATPPNPYCFQALATTQPFTSTGAGSTTFVPSTGAGSTTFVPSTGASTGSYSTTFAFSGGVSFCTQCGSPGMYACSDKSSWTGGNLTFLDQTPSGNTITSFLLTTTGSYACGSGISSLMIGAVQNTAITTAIAAPTTNHCACNTCDGAVTVSSSEFPWGFALNYGGKNTFSLSVFNNPACLYEATLTAYYKPSAPYYSTGITVNSPSNDPSVICGRGGALFCSITSTCTIGSFNDPLPKGSLLISATVNIFGNFFPGSTSCADSRQGYVTFAAQTFSATSISNSDSCFNTNYCSAPWSNSSPSLYQNGLAGYRYGASNSFTLTITSKGSQQYYYVSYSIVTLYYIASSK